MVRASIMILRDTIKYEINSPSDEEQNSHVTNRYTSHYATDNQTTDNNWNDGVFLSSYCLSLVFTFHS